MNIIVTGHQGHIGEKLVPQLTVAGHSVFGVDLKSYGDALDFEPYEAFMGIEEPDAIIHLAAMTSVLESVEDVKEYARTNILGTIHMLDVARDFDIPIILASSGGTIHEPISPYGMSKQSASRFGFLYNDLYDVKVIDLALANVYGPGMGGLVQQLMDDWEAYDPGPDGKPVPRGVTIRGDGTQTRDFIYIDDVVAAFVLALDWDAGYYEIATGVSTSVFEVFRKMTFLYGYTPKRTNVPLPAADVMWTKLRCDLPWEPVSLDEGLRRTVPVGANK